MRKICGKKYIVIFQQKESGEYVVYNTRKQWKEGHTHISTYKQAIYLADCIINRKIPQKVNKYFLISLIRLSNDSKYTQDIQNRIDNVFKKKQYYNTPKGFRD